MRIEPLRRNCVCWFGLKVSVSIFSMHSPTSDCDRRFRLWAPVYAEIPLTYGVLQTGIRVDGFSVITSSTLESFGKVRDLLVLFSEFVQCFHTALCDHCWSAGSQ